MPSQLIRNAVMFVNASGKLFRNLGVAIANPTAIDAHVKLTLRDQSGTASPQRTSPWRTETRLADS